MRTFQHRGNGHAGMTRAFAWTVEDACTELAEQYGVHVSPRHLRLVLRGLPGLAASGESPPGPAGGRGAKLYPVPALQVLGGFLIGRGWLQSPPLTGQEARDRKRGTGKQAERAARRRLPARCPSQGSCVRLTLAQGFLVSVPGHSPSAGRHARWPGRAWKPPRSPGSPTAGPPARGSAAGVRPQSRSSSR